MIQSVIERYEQLASLPGMKWSPQQRLVLASLLIDRTQGEMERFRQLAGEIERQTSLFSTVKSLRYVIAAFLCRMEGPVEITVSHFFSTHEAVKRQKIARFLQQYEAVIALLLTLQQKKESPYSLPEHLSRVDAAYDQWRKLHSFLTNQNLLPVLTLATNRQADIKQLVADTEATYQRLLNMKLKQSTKTMQFSWLLTTRQISADAAGNAFLRYKELFRQRKISGSTSAIHLLILHGLAPETTVPEVAARFDTLKKEKSFRFFGTPLLLRIATGSYLRETHLQSLQEQAGEQFGLEDSQRDLRLIDDALETMLVLTILATTDGGGGDAGIGGDCGDGGGDGGGGGGDC